MIAVDIAVFVKESCSGKLVYLLSAIGQILSPTLPKNSFVEVHFGTSRVF
jgi:hypothetical protein